MKGRKEKEAHPERKSETVKKSLTYVVVPQESALSIVKQMLGADQILVVKKDTVPKELLLTRSGELYRSENRTQFSFIFKDRRATLLKSFAGEGNDLIPSAQLRKEAGYKNAQSLYKAIDAINTIARRELGIAEKELVESSTKGFRVIPTYKIVLEKR
jgi:hypothetical protein